MPKALFIVDIQQKYNNSFRKEYLDKVKRYLEDNGDEYEKIVMIMEENPTEGKGDFIPSDIHRELTIRPIFKCYDAEYSNKKLKNSKYFQVKNNSLIPKIKFPEGDFCLPEKSGFLVGKKEDGEIYIDYMGKDLYLLLNLLRGYDIDLIGGGINHCVKKTKEYFHFIGIDSVTIKKDLCYSISYQKNACPEYLFDRYIENKQED